jgi:tetratricopeptide (TPR) repeat protein
MPLAVTVLAAAFVGLAQAGQEAPQADRAEASHVERFASPHEKAMRAEADATARLRAKADDVEALVDRGASRLALRELNGALADFRRAADLDPKRVDVLTSYGYVLSLLNRKADARAALERALALDPKEPFANYHYGRTLLASGGDARTAIVHLERALTSRPDLTEIRVDLFSAYRVVGDAALASAQLRYLMEARPRDPRNAYLQGLLASDRGDLDAAVERFRAALSAFPGLSAARRDLALALVRSGRWSEAEPVLEALVASTPAAFEPAYLRALTRFNLGRRAEAEADARELARRFPTAAPAHTLLGIALLGGAGTAEAIASLRKATDLDPAAFDANLYLGRALFGERAYEDAAAAFARAVAAKPDDVQARFFYATALEYGGSSDQAFAQYEELARRSPTSAEGFVGLGAVQARRGDFEAAAGSLARAVELAPGLFEAQFRLGTALSRAGRLEEAIAALGQAVELEPNRADGHYQLGLALRRAGRADEAAREFATVERLNEEFRSRTGGMGR